VSLPRNQQGQEDEGANVEEQPVIRAQSRKAGEKAQRGERRTARAGSYYRRGQVGQGGVASGRNTRPKIRDSQVGSRFYSTQQQQLASPKGKKAKEPELSSADKLRAQIAVQKATKAASESENWWAARLENINDIQEVPERRTAIAESACS